ncbi:MAG: LytTR family DNA-binding domain-containing protein [Bacteroidota bacterium]
MKVVIIDDEQKARRVLESIVTELFPQFTQVAQASNLMDGVKMIQTLQPQIVFLDIEMPEHSGLELFKFIDINSCTFQLIFVTAYNKYAIDAFKLSALDYLLKPVSRIELKNTVQRALKNIEKQEQQLNLDTLKKIFKKISVKKIKIDVPGGIRFVNYEDILYFEADGMYTKIHIRNHTSEIMSKPLKYFEEQFKDNLMFFRIHRSYLVNMEHIQKLIRNDGFYIVLDTNITLPVTKSRQQDFLTIVEDIY